MSVHSLILSFHFLITDKLAIEQNIAGLCIIIALYTSRKQTEVINDKAGTVQISDDAFVGAPDRPVRY